MCGAHLRSSDIIHHNILVLSCPAPSLQYTPPARNSVSLTYESFREQCCLASERHLLYVQCVVYSTVYLCMPSTQLRWLQGGLLGPEPARMTKAGETLHLKQLRLSSKHNPVVGYAYSGFVALYLASISAAPPASQCNKSHAAAALPYVPVQTYSNDFLVRLLLLIASRGTCSSLCCQQQQ